jgi:hypothetical protein
MKNLYFHSQMLRGLSIIKNDDLILIKVEMPINHAPLSFRHEKEAQS